MKQARWERILELNIKRLEGNIGLVEEKELFKLESEQMHDLACVRYTLDQMFDEDRNYGRGEHFGGYR